MRPDDLLSFSSGCFEVARALIDLAGRGYDCLLIPCRGAFPVLTGAIEALKTVKGEKTLREILRSLLAPRV